MYADGQSWLKKKVQDITQSSYFGHAFPNSLSYSRISWFLMFTTLTL
jgi:hypothetical protein